MNVLTLIRVSLRIAITTLVSSSLTLKAAAHDLPLNAYELQSHHLQMVDDCIGAKPMSKSNQTCSDANAKSDSPVLASPGSSPTVPHPLVTSSQGLWFSSASKIVAFIPNSTQQWGSEILRLGAQWLSADEPAQSRTNSSLFVSRPKVGLPPSPVSHKEVLAEAAAAEASPIDCQSEVTMADFVPSFEILHSSVRNDRIDETYLPYDLSVRDWCFRGGFGYGPIRNDSSISAWKLDELVGKMISTQAESLRENSIAILDLAALGRGELDRLASGVTADWLAEFLPRELQPWAKVERPFYDQPNLVTTQLDGVTIVMTRHQAIHWGFATEPKSDVEESSLAIAWKRLSERVTELVSNLSSSQRAVQVASAPSIVTQ